MKVNVVCRNFQDDRVLPRYARYLAEHNGWALSKRAAPGYDITLYMAYFEHQLNPHFTGTRAAYFTHLEADGGAKVQLYNDVAGIVDLRVAMNQGQLAHLQQYGPSAVVPLPLELERFKPRPPHHRQTPVIGFSGYTYRTGRKGEALAQKLVNDVTGVKFTASGRGWPCDVKRYTWRQMPSFFQNLDVFVCTSLVEGGPMTTLEALACGVPVVIPDSVGIHPQIPDTVGVYRYATGDYEGLVTQTLQAIEERHDHDPQALREATAPHSVATFCEGMRELFENHLYTVPDIPNERPDWRGKSGVYVVAFGDPSRACAIDCINSIHANMPGVPVALCSDRPLGAEDIFIQQPDKDIGGRIAKLKAYDLAPRDWEYVLYVDADTEIVADVSVFFQWMADGWEFAICKDAHLHDTMYHFQRRNNKDEYHTTINELGTTEALQINGGVWAFRRCARVRRYFKRLLQEWNKYQGRDQGAMIRALYTEPLRVLWLCNEWNTLVTAKGHEYPPTVAGTAGIVHRVGKARRWRGQVPSGKGLLDPEAWEMVEKFMRSYNASD